MMQTLCTLWTTRVRCAHEVRQHYLFKIMWIHWKFFQRIYRGLSLIFFYLFLFYLFKLFTTKCSSCLNASMGRQSIVTCLTSINTLVAVEEQLKLIWQLYTLMIHVSFILEHNYTWNDDHITGVLSQIHKKESRLSIKIQWCAGFEKCVIWQIKL